MLPQDHLIARVRELCQTDDRVQAAMMYGSFAYGEGDTFSDIEFVLFFADDAFENLDQRAWLEQIAPVELLFVNEHGITVVIFENLVRGEFHFHRMAEIGLAAMWRGVVSFPTLESTLIADKTGALTPYLQAITGPPPERTTPPQLQTLVDSFINWSLFGFNVLRRGEHARALELLNILHRHLLQMARALEGQTGHWLTPSRLAEQDLAPETCTRLVECTAPLEPRALRRAYGQCWAWGGELMAGLRTRWGIRVPDELCWRITALVNANE
jgi:lincosamide nucleotidyltransferase B/F